MNKDRRNRIEKLADEIGALADQVDEIQQEEQDYIDNMPENLREGQLEQTAQDAADALEETASALRDAVESLQTAAGG